MKRQFKIMFIFSVFVIVLVACFKDDQKDVNTNDDGNVNISVFAPQGSDVDLKTNSFTKLAEEKFNINFNWETTTYDTSAAAEARNIAMASGDYPDLFLLIPWVDQFSQTDLLKYGKQGAIVPLNELIEEHAPNIQEVLENHEYYAAMVTAPDGKIYGLPQLNECFHCTYSAKMWMNKTWLEELNLDIPTTHEELKSVLKAFKTEDPNGNGKNDEVPLSGATEVVGGGVFTFLMNGFIYDDGVTRLLLEDEKVDFAPIQPEWKEGLAYMRELYEEGLLDSGTFSQNEEALSQLGGSEEQLLGSTVVPHPAPIFGSDREIHNQYEPVPPLDGPNTSWGQYDYNSKPGGTFVLTNTASEEAQVAAIKLIDYMFTEDGQIRSHYGEEDVSWRKPEDGDVAIREEVEPIFATIPLDKDEDPKNDSWDALAQYYQPFEFRDGWVQDIDIYSPEGYERRLQEATYLYEGTEPEEVYPHWAVWYDSEIVDEISMIKTNIEDYVEQNSVQFITGDKDLETEWDTYIEGFEQLELERYLEVMQEAFENAKF